MNNEDIYYEVLLEELEEAYDKLPQVISNLQNWPDGEEEQLIVQRSLFQVALDISNVLIDIPDVWMNQEVAAQLSMMLEGLIDLFTEESEEEE